MTSRRHPAHVARAKNTLMKAVKIIKAVIRGILIAVCGVLCLYNIYMLVARYAFGIGMPTVFGYAGAAVISGSMDDDSGEDDIEIGDFVITQSMSDYAVGDVITFSSPEEGIYITHRIIAVTEAGYTTKGDNNNSQDNFTVPPQNVVGKVVCVLHGAGNALQFLRSPTGLLAVLGGGVVIWLLADVVAAIFSRNKDEQQQD